MNWIAFIQFILQLSDKLCIVSRSLHKEKEGGGTTQVRDNDWREQDKLCFRGQHSHVGKRARGSGKVLIDVGEEPALRAHFQVLRRGFGISKVTRCNCVLDFAESNTA